MSKKKKQAVEMLISKHTPLPDRFGPNATQKFRFGLYSSLGMSAMKSGNYSIARSSYLRALQCNPQLCKELAYLGVSMGGQLTHRPALVVKRMILD